MPFLLTMPKLSPTMEEGTLVKWHKKEGDKIKAGDLLVEIATDKATVEHTALDPGYLRKILLTEGKSAKVNDPIAICSEKPDDNIEGFMPVEVKKEAPKTKAVEKASSTPQAASAPTPTAFQPEAPLSNYEFPFPTDRAAGRKPASPLAKKLAKEKGLDLTSVKGSGPGGRVTSRDLDLSQPDQVISFSKKEVPTIAPGTYEEVPLTPMRKVIATRLQQAKTYIPHIYIRQEIDAEPLVSLREQLKAANIKLSLNDFILRASAIALREHPQINSGFNAANQTILLFKTIDISVAVSMDQGLITPIIRHADYKNLGELSQEVKELATRAKAGKLQEHEYKGGSFTISNMGMYGVSDFAAIINPPQSSILAVGAVEDCPRIKGGEVVPGKKLSLVLSCDHRVVDGSDGAKFLATLKKLLETPSLLLI